MMETDTVIMAPEGDLEAFPPIFLTPSVEPLPPPISPEAYAAHSVPSAPVQTNDFINVHGKEKPIQPPKPPMALPLEAASCNQQCPTEDESSSTDCSTNNECCCADCCSSVINMCSNINNFHRCMIVSIIFYMLFVIIAATQRNSDWIQMDCLLQSQSNMCGRLLDLHRQSWQKDKGNGLERHYFYMEYHCCCFGRGSDQT